MTQLLMLSVWFIAAFILSLVLSAPKNMLVVEEVTMVEISTKNQRLCSTMACGLCVVLLDILQPLALSPKVDEWSSELVKRICEWNGKSKQDRFMCWVIMYDTVKMLLKQFHDMNPREACQNTTLCSPQPNYSTLFSTGSSLQETNLLISQHLQCFALRKLFLQAPSPTNTSTNTIAADATVRLYEDLAKLVAALL